MSEQIKDGGPAFPLLNPAIGYHADIRRVSPGLSLRDYFAAKAMQAILNGLVSSGVQTDHEVANQIASAAYIAADAMIAASEAQS